MSVKKKTWNNEGIDEEEKERWPAGTTGFMSLSGATLPVAFDVGGALTVLLRSCEHLVPSF
jgi:hypothetical protein